MKNIRSFNEYINEKKSKEEKSNKEEKSKEVEKEEEVVEEKPQGLTPKQQKNLPEPLKNAILKAQKERVNLKSFDEYTTSISEAGIYKDKWEKDDLTLALYNSIYGTRGLGMTEKELAEDVIGSSLSSLKMQSANFDHLRGLRGLDRPHSIESSVYDEYKNISQNELRQICLRIISDKGKTGGLNFQKTFRERTLKKYLENEFRKKGFDPSKMRSLGTRPTLSSMLEDPEDTP